MPDKALELAQTVLREALANAELDVHRARKAFERAELRLKAAQSAMSVFLAAKYEPEVQKPEAQVSEIQAEA